MKLRQVLLAGYMLLAEIATIYALSAKPLLTNNDKGVIVLMCLLILVTIGWIRHLIKAH